MRYDIVPGWKEDDIEIIDKNWGITAADASQREGFKEMVAQVTLQKEGWWHFIV